MRTALFLFTFGSLLSAQTFVIDAAAGPGSQFTDIQTAVQTVPDGAVLIVRAGGYASFTISGKGVSVLGEPGAFVSGVNVLLQIDSTSPTQRVVVRDLSLVAASNGNTVIDCASCQGPVLLQRLVASPSLSRRLRVHQCDQVFVDTCGPFRDSTFFQTIAMQVGYASVVLVGCTVDGVFNNALQLSQADVHLVGCTVRGGSVIGISTYAAIQMNASTLRLAGASSVFGNYVLLQAPGVLGSGTLVHDPSATITGYVQATVASSIVGLPAVTSVSGTSGTTTIGTMTVPAGQLGVLALGITGPRTNVPGFVGELWLDAATVTPLVAGVAGTNLVAVVNVPANPLLLGATFGWQGASHDSTAGFRLSNPAWFAP